jgi:predicted nucleotide-binding protein
LNHIKELKIHVEALKNIVRIDSYFFRSITTYVEKLDDLLNRATTSFDLNEVSVCITKINEFFDQYRADSSSGSLYIPPDKITNSDKIVLEIIDICEQLNSMQHDELQNIILALDEEYSEEKSKDKTLIKTDISIPSAGAKQSPNKEYFNKVFVVHVHDEIVKNEIELFLISSGLEPIVLHRQPDQGKTIIEKFEKYSDVGFALVILTPDDCICNYNQEKKIYEPSGKRARQNVVFEWGFFVGKLGRERVCCLHKKSVELPSDIHGVLYKPFQDSIDEIKYDLLQELKAAGYKIAF